MNSAESLEQTLPESVDTGLPPSKRARTRAKPLRLRPRRLSFFGFLTLWTTIASIPMGLAGFAAARPLGTPLALLVGLLFALSLYLPFKPVVLHNMLDRPRDQRRVQRVELPYLAHWCAAQVALIATALGTIGWLGCALIAQASLVFIPSWSLAGYVAGAMLAVWGMFVRRHWVRVRRYQVPIENLDPRLDGYRIVQLSDLHVGTFVSRQKALRWVRLAKKQKADLAVVTGDMVSSGIDFHTDIAEALGELTAPDGAVVVPGNHDYFGDGLPLFHLLEKKGLRVLRNDSFWVERDGAKLLIAGVDDTWTRHADMARTLRHKRSDVPTVLLAHDPALFDAAARAKVELTLSGHTHGGQVAVPFLARWLNLSSLAHAYNLGRYAKQASVLIISAGLGTTGPPIRLGAAPELVVVELRAPKAAS